MAIDINKPKGKVIRQRLNDKGELELQMNVVEKDAQHEIVTLPNGMRVPIVMNRAARKELEAEVKRAIKKNRPIRVKNLKSSNIRTNFNGDLPELQHQTEMAVAKAEADKAINNENK